MDYINICVIFVVRIEETMRRLLLLSLFATFATVCFSQTIKNEGAKIIVTSGTSIIFDNLHNSGLGGYFYYNTPLNLPGDWTNVSPASFDQGASGTVTLTGTAQQTIASGGSSFRTMTINNTSGSNQAIVLSDDMEIENSLTLTDGIVNTNGNTLIFQATTTSDVGNASSFVDGKMRKSGAVPFTFPSGDIEVQDFDGNGNVTYKVWSPMTANPVASTSVDVEYFFDDAGMPDWWEHSGNMDATLHHVSNREYYLVSSTEDFADVTLYWNDNAHAAGDICNHGFDYGDDADFVAADLVVSYWNGSMWVDADFNSGSSSIAHDQGYVTSRFAVPFGAKSQTFITLGSKNNQNPLPVELVSLSADCSGSQVDIIWQTASETNNSGFVVEKSSDGKTFAQIGFVDGAGNSNRPKSYVFSDLNPINGTNYYRLKQIDTDGKFVYTKIITTSCENENNPEPSFIVYPNPTTDILNISAEYLPGKTAVVNVYNVLGALVWQSKENTSAGMIFTRYDMSALPPAVYMVKVVSDDFVGVKKIEKH